MKEKLHLLLGDRLSLIPQNFINATVSPYVSSAGNTPKLKVLDATCELYDEGYYRANEYYKPVVKI